MSGSMILTLIGSALIFAGQRLFDGQDGMSMGATGLGVLAMLAALGLRWKAKGEADNASNAAAHMKAFMFQDLALVAVLVYGLSTDWTVDLLGLSDAAASRWSVSFTAVWPILWLAGVIPATLVDMALQDTAVVPAMRVRQAVDNGLVAALGLCLVFPLNYLAKEYNHRWDLAYFKTTEPGDSTRAIVDNLNEPAVVRIFMPTSSDVTPEVVPYFKSLESDKLRVEVMDHAAEPVLAKELKIRDNGYVAVTFKDGTEDAATKSWKVGTELDSSKRNLKKLDGEFRKKLLELAKGKRTIYFTVGHGEMNWKGGELPDDKLTGVKKVLGEMNFKVSELGLTKGLGDAIPDDASMVFIVGPEEPFLPAEITALQTYLDRGGSLFIAVEPEGEPLDELLGGLGLKRGVGQLASEGFVLRRTGDKADRINLVTNRYSSHESTATLSKFSQQLSFITPGAGFLEETKAGRGKVTVTVRSLAESWADLDGDLDFDSDAEKKEVRSLATVVSGPASSAEGEEAAEFRAIAIADATAISDLTLGNRGNLQYVLDGVGWLMNEAELSGTVENEEDVKIEHTQEDQVAWFYGTIMGIPGLVLLFGFFRVRSRRKGGEA